MIRIPHSDLLYHYFIFKCNVDHNLICPLLTISWINIRTISEEDPAISVRSLLLNYSGRVTDSL